MIDDQPHILIVEDESKLARLLSDYLQRSGYQASIVSNGNEVLPLLDATPVDLMLLDLMLPGRGGLDICRDIRAGNTHYRDLPIIMITARVEEIDRLLGLELGADDYICKPFSPREVIARVKAVLRRLGKSDSDNEPIRLDADSHRVHAGDSVTDLTSVEYHLLATLSSQPGRIFTRDQLMDRIYSDGRIVSDRTIDSHIKKLRRKLREMLPDQELVHSVYGAGYRYEPAAADPGAAGNDR